jgi:putative transposase
MLARESMSVAPRRNRKRGRPRRHSLLGQDGWRAFSIEEDEHLGAVLRYIEREPLRAGLLGWAEAWPWSSPHGWAAGLPAAFLDPVPLPRGGDWVE